MKTVVMIDSLLAHSECEMRLSTDNATRTTPRPFRITIDARIVRIDNSRATSPRKCYGEALLFA